MNGNLTEAQHVGDSVKASTLGFGPLVAMESVKKALNQALIIMKEDLVKKLTEKGELLKGPRMASLRLHICMVDTLKTVSFQSQFP